MDKKGIFSSALLMMIGTLISRFLGLLRESVMAFLFGASPAYDAFLIAFLVPNLLRQLLAEGALSSSFIPVFNEYLAKEGRKGAWKLLNLLLNVVLILFGVIIPLGYLILPYVVRILAPGFSTDTFKLCVSLSQITLPFIFFISLAAITMGALNSFGNFFVPGVASSFFNISIIIFALLFYKSLGIYAVAIGTTIGGGLQWIFQFFWLRRLGWRYEPILDIHHEGIKRIGLMMLPLTFSLAINQVQNLVDKIVASLLSPGGISVINYAFRLYQLPLGVFAVSFSTVALPLLSKDVLKDGSEDFEETLSSALRLALFIVLPASIFLIIFSPALVNLLFYRGAFSDWAFKNTYLTLMFYSLGLSFSAMSHITLRAFYALKDTKTPALMGVWVVALNAVLNIVFGKLLGPPGLALATSLASLANFLLLKRSLILKGIRIEILSFTLRVLLPSLAFFLLSSLSLKVIHNVWLSVLISIVLFLPYVFLSAWLGIEEAKIFVERGINLFRKMRR